MRLINIYDTAFIFISQKLFKTFGDVIKCHHQLPCYPCSCNLQENNFNYELFPSKILFDFIICCISFYYLTTHSTNFVNGYVGVRLNENTSDTNKTIINKQTPVAQSGIGFRGARCSSVVRAFTHGAMGRRIDPSWLTHRAISCSSQCSTTGISKAVV